MSLNVNLTPKLEDMVRRKVADGLYNNASEVMRDALRMMEANDRLQAARLDAVRFENLREDLRDGLASGSAGELDISAIKQNGRARLSQS